MRTLSTTALALHINSDHPLSFPSNLNNGAGDLSSERVSPFHSLDAHQSGTITIQRWKYEISRTACAGVNAFDVQQLEDCDDGLSYALVSGGDDQSLRLVVFSLFQAESFEESPVDPEAESAQVDQPSLTALRVRAEFKVSLAHASAIKGMECHSR